MAELNRTPLLSAEFLNKLELVSRKISVGWTAERFDD
jgi:hypothetical protein